MSKKDELDLARISFHPLLPELESAYKKYQVARERVRLGEQEEKIISTLVAIATAMYSKAWVALKQSNVEAWENTVHSAQLEFKEFLLGQGFEAVQALTLSTDCLELLKVRYRDEELVKDLLVRVVEELRDSGVSMSNIENERRLRQGDYPTFKKFFGMTYRTYSQWLAQRQEKRK
ncbi:MAG: hypothetical protein ACE5NG_07300 [bacterium]